MSKWTVSASKLMSKEMKHVSGTYMYSVPPFTNNEGLWAEKVLTFIKNKKKNTKCSAQTSSLSLIHVMNYL